MDFPLNGNPLQKSISDKAFMILCPSKRTKKRKAPFIWWSESRSWMADRKKDRKRKNIP